MDSGFMMLVRYCNYWIFN